MSKQDITIKQYVDTIMESMNNRLTSIEEKLDTFIECADTKYASKQVEKFVYGFFGAFLLTLIGIVGYLLDKYTIH